MADDSSYGGDRNVDGLWLCNGPDIRHCPRIGYSAAREMALILDREGIGFAYRFSSLRVSVLA